MTKDIMNQTKTIIKIHKKIIFSTIILVVLLGGISAGAHAAFQISGVVTGVDNSSITVANFLRTQTVDLTGAPINAANIKPGDRVKLRKNLQGNIFSIQVFQAKDGEHKHNQRHDYD